MTFEDIVISDYDSQYVSSNQSSSFEIGIDNPEISNEQQLLLSTNSQLVSENGSAIQADVTYGQKNIYSTPVKIASSDVDDLWVDEDGITYVRVGAKTSGEFLKLTLDRRELEGSSTYSMKLNWILTTGP